MSQPPTSVRYSMIAATTLVAILLYLDRVCLSILNSQIEPLLGDTPEQRKDRFAALTSAFFWTYALFQLPAGWLGDRYGARRVLGAYLFLWSAATFFLGFAQGFAAFLVLRLLCGLFEAGAYPLAAGIVRTWMPFAARGRASSLVAVGGRLGGAIAPSLTIALTTAAVDGWQRPFLVYGGVGMLGAVAFYLWYRDDPAAHPSVNRAEVELIGSDPRPRSALGRPPLGAFVRSPSLWLMSVVQFMSNFAWVFILTLFPAYLTEVFQTPDAQKATYQSWPLYAGILGMLLGGFLTDRLVRSLGLRWGRMVPLIGSKLLIGVAWCVCIVLDDPLSITLMMCLVAWGTDLGNPPMWAFSQDVGGRHVGAVLGWCNMWGNFGAAVAPLVLTAVSKQFGWPVAFGVCAATQVVAALAALGIDASRKVG